MIAPPNIGFVRVSDACIAAPTGGARASRGWGCNILTALSMSLTLLALSAEAGVPVDVPSGQPVELHEVLVDDEPGQTWLRFRFVAPQIVQDQTSVWLDNVSDDMDHLCDAIAVPYLTVQELTPFRIVISLSDRPVEFGASDPEATQFFELYSLSDGSCMWEEY